MLGSDKALTTKSAVTVESFPPENEIHTTSLYKNYNTLKKVLAKVTPLSLEEKILDVYKRQISFTAFAAYKISSSVLKYPKENLTQP